MSAGKHAQKPTQKKLDYSKRLISDIRALLWLVTAGVLALTGLCIVLDYMGALPWLAVMVGLPWSAHGVVCSFYMDLAKSDHREGGITFESAKANNFSEKDEAAGSIDSPAI